MTAEDVAAFWDWILETCGVEYYMYRRYVLALEEREEERERGAE